MYKTKSINHFFQKNTQKKVVRSQNHKESSTQIFEMVTNNKTVKKEIFTTKLKKIFYSRMEREDKNVMS